MEVYEVTGDCEWTLRGYVRLNDPDMEDAKQAWSEARTLFFADQMEW